MSKSPQGSFRDEKRARFSATPKKKRRRISPALWVVGGLVLLGIVGGILIALSGGSPRATAAAPGGTTGGAGNVVGSAAVAATLGHAPYPEVKAEDGVIRLPLATFADNQAHFYTYVQNGQPIEFFVVKDSTGQVHTSFNACDVCFPARKGYRQEGNVMVCNNCGRRFPIEQIGQVAGGCNPSPLTAGIEGDNVVIRVEDLATGFGLFQ